MGVQSETGVMRERVLGEGELVEDRLQFLEDVSRGKSVLHVGCVDSGSIDEKLSSNMLLHARLAAVASELYGVDIDEEGLARLQSLGFENLIAADVEAKIQIKRQFEVIVAGEVMEHLGKPMAFLEQVKGLLEPGGKFVITVPNAFSVAGFAKVCFGAEVVHRDHVSYYSPATIECLLARVGLVVDTMMFCSDTTRLSGARLFRKKIFNKLVLKNRVGLAEVLVVVAR